MREFAFRRERGEENQLQFPLPTESFRIRLGVKRILTIRRQANPGLRAGLSAKKIFRLVPGQFRNSNRPSV